MRTREADFLVVGSGIAGLWFARRVAQSGSVLVVTKKTDSESNTNYAQGGIAAAVAADDSPRLHYEDTIRVGAGIAHPDIVRIVTESGPRLVRELHELGVAFTIVPDTPGGRQFDLGREGGHRRRRIVHARDLTGLEIEHGLLRAVRSCATVAILEQHLATDVVLDRNGRCCGALVLPARGEPEFIRASVCLLATGGIGQVYEHTTNPQIATGDGVAVGYRAGAVIANMEFVQFHPTALFGHRVDGRAFLISEAVRGEGALLLARSGRRFMPDYHPDAELAPRDVVARAIANELHRGGDRFVLLDATGIGAERLRERFPTIYRTCLDIGVDMTAEAVPVVPAAHYVCGGVQTNGWGESTVPGLFAAGECACSGLHGANRLASNSLLEALVLADRAAERVLTSAVQPSAARSGAGVPRAVRAVTNESVQELRSLMWSSAGMVRSDAGLAAARHRLAELDSVREHPATALTAGAVESDNLLTVARLTVECAMRRPESRGLHYNENHPMPSDALAKDTLVSRSELESGC